MNKRVLAIYYTQSGQMGEIIDAFTAPLTEAGVSVETSRIKLVANYDFPWTGKRFFSVMPSCVLGIPEPLEPLNLKEVKYDLVILGYQPWFLSPSIPSNSLLQSEEFKAVIKETPVITISAGRNMWINSYVRVRNMIKDSGAKLVGNIALLDKHPNPISFVTIFYWMLTGKKERYLNIFPKPGVSEQDIAATAEFGRTVTDHLKTNNWETLQDELIKQKAVEINYKLMFIEARAKPIFKVWAMFIAKRKNRDLWLSAFKYYLFVALFLGAPVLLTLDAIFLKPFSSKRIKRNKLKYLQVTN
ncbi:hypothetical protein [Mucilaginibacter xinganensis]|uniref:Dialkylrecorsinol condensing enzyme DarA n=1 Tax=Mucilaginibacter xinganensis TaxID=1234841 RepID=A0A223NY01_9SPHI|nr:hypothetical protein [Mucilaginibacter xinganensis]ASU34584.1 hypothetical protein MuYL_2697 [Mucilaginibacter xinganensis]